MRIFTIGINGKTSVSKVAWIRLKASENTRFTYDGRPRHGSGSADTAKQS